MLSEDEFREMLDEQNIRLVGYGYQVDRKKGLKEELKRKLEAGEKLETSTPREFKEKSLERLQMEAVLENYSVGPKSGFIEFPSASIPPEFEVDKKKGVKMYTDTRIQASVQQYLLSGVKGEDNGACNGDSGGGAFYKTKAGEWRYAGVINMKSAAGCGSGFYPLGGANIYNANTATLIMVKGKTEATVEDEVAPSEEEIATTEEETTEEE